MGFTYIEIRCFHPAELARSEVVELLVGSGAIFTPIPHSIPGRLGIKPITC